MTKIPPYPHPPQKNLLIKNVVYWKLKHVSKYAGTILRVAYIQTISHNKNENQASRLGVESRIAKNSVFPPNAEIMLYD